MHERDHVHQAILRSDSGLDLSSDFWMHRHFRAMAEVYHSLLLQAEFLPGDRVLDLGCGSGTHFAWLTRIIGPEGRIVGHDPDAANLRLASERVAGAAWGAQVEELREGALTQLPYPDGSFDAVWCAGSLQYLADPIAAIREMVRVVRPGGKVAAQDVEMHPLLLGPMPDDLLIALKDCMPRGETGQGYVDWFVGHKLRGYFHAAGLREVRGFLRLREYTQPLTQDERGFLEVAMPYLCTASPGIHTLPAERAQALRDLTDPEHPDWMFGKPDFTFLEGRALAVGLR